MSEDNIDKLYKNYDILSAATDKSVVSNFRVFVVISEKWQPRDITILMSEIKLRFRRVEMLLIKLNKHFHFVLISSNLKRKFYVFSSLRSTKKNTKRFWTLFMDPKRKRSSPLSSSSSSSNLFQT